MSNVMTLETLFAKNALTSEMWWWVSAETEMLKIQNSVMMEIPKMMMDAAAHAMNKQYLLEPSQAQWLEEWSLLD